VYYSSPAMPAGGEDIDTTVNALASVGMGGIEEIRTVPTTGALST